MTDVSSRCPCILPISLDEEFSLQELRFALRSFRRRCTPGPDGITYQALKNLDDSMLPRLLAIYNEVWCTGDIPVPYCTSVVVPVHKQGKPLHELSFYRLISLTSCVGKLREKMVHRRPSRMLDNVVVLPQEMPGLRRQPCTADSLADLVSSLKEARATLRPPIWYF